MPTVLPTTPGITPPALADPPAAQTARTNAPAGPGKESPLYINPNYRFDPSVGLTVIEFRDEAGVVTNTIPSQRQLDAYRLHQTPLPGQPSPPVGKSPHR